LTLPAGWPFDDHHAAFERLRTDTRVPRTTVPSYDGRRDRVSQQHMALPALWSAAAADPLAAELESLSHTIVTFGKPIPTAAGRATQGVSRADFALTDSRERNACSCRATRRSNNSPTIDSNLMPTIVTVTVRMRVKGVVACDYLIGCLPVLK
jgi:hypothetical protein